MSRHFLKKIFIFINPVSSTLNLAEIFIVVEFLLSIIDYQFQIGGIILKPFNILLYVILPVIGSFIIYKLILFLINKFIIKPIRIKQEKKDKIKRYIKIIFRILFFLCIIFIIINYLGPNLTEYFLVLWDILQKPFFQAGATQVSIITIILTIPIFYIAAWVSRRLKIIFDTKLLTRVTIEKSLKFTISSLVRYSILAIFLIIGLSVIGIDLSSIAVLFGVLGIGVGFGLQNVVANMFAGIVIIFERPIKEGDRIMANGIEGDIIKIKLRSTIIKTLTNENIIIPNSKLIDQNLHNYSFGNPEIIICNSVQVSYQTDIDKASKVLLQIAGKNPYILANKEPETRIITFENSGILLELRTWIKNAQNKLEALSWTNMQIWRAFKEYDITIPFPQLDLHVKDSKFRLNMVQTKKS